MLVHVRHKWMTINIHIYCFKNKDRINLVLRFGVFFNYTRDMFVFDRGNPSERQEPARTDGGHEGGAVRRLGGSQTAP